VNDKKLPGKRTAMRSRGCRATVYYLFVQSETVRPGKYSLRPTCRGGRGEKNPEEKDEEGEKERSLYVLGTMTGRDM